MLKSFHYPASFTPDEDGCPAVRFPDFPGAITGGHDMAEAMDEASDCLGCAIAFTMLDKLPIPKPSRPAAGQLMVPVPMHLAPKLALYITLREQRVSNAELARRLGVRETVVRRMLDSRHHSRPERLNAALAALGRRLVVRMEAA